MATKRKRIEEREWWVHIRPHDQPVARISSTLLGDGGASDDPEALAKVLARTVEMTMRSALDQWGDLFRKQCREGRIMVEIRAADMEDDDAQ